MANRIFLASSTDALPTLTEIGGALTAVLGETVELIYWNDAGAAQPGKTLIKLLEDEKADADFAIVLLTRSESHGDAFSPNVMFEAGLFIGDLERYRTILISDATEEMPSDLSGVLHYRLDTTPVDEIVRGIAAVIRHHGRRIRPQVELGSLEYMLNICTPDHQDHQTPHTDWVNHQVRVRSSDDFLDLARSLLVQYVIGSMSPATLESVRAYVAVYLGDGTRVEVDGGAYIVDELTHPTNTTDPHNFVVAISNPRVDGETVDAELLQRDWRVGLPIPGFRGDKALSTCADAFTSRDNVTRGFRDKGNVSLSDEEEVLVIPVLWNEGPNSAAIALLGLSARKSGEIKKADNAVRRLLMTANVLGMAAHRFAREAAPEPENAIGVHDAGPPTSSSFERRAVRLRRLIAAQVLEEQIRAGLLNPITGETGVLELAATDLAGVSR